MIILVTVTQAHLQVGLSELKSTAPNVTVPMKEFHLHRVHTTGRTVESLGKEATLAFVLVCRGPGKVGAIRYIFRFLQANQDLLIFSFHHLIS